MRQNASHIGNFKFPISHILNEAGKIDSIDFTEAKMHIFLLFHTNL